MISIQVFKRIFAIPPLNTELEKTKKDLAALKEQAAGLTREYDRLLDEHSKAQVGIDFLKVVRLVFWSGVVGPGTNELSLARASRSQSRYALKSSTCEQV